MCANKAVFVLLFAVIACAVAIPASIPQPQGPQSIGQRQIREIDPLEAGAEGNQDLKGSSSYGYGYYGYPGYGYGYGYPGYGYGGYGGYGYGGYPYLYGGYRSYYPYYYRPYGYY